MSILIDKMPCSKLDHILDNNQAVPRYTSYPTTPHFQQMSPESNDLHLKWLKSLSSENKISLYIHIPFCKEMCWYCGCNTKATHSYRPVEKYVEHLIQEIEVLSKNLEANLEIYNLHFGGGSPGYLTADDFTRIVNVIKKHFKLSLIAEFSIELDPRLVTQDRIEAYANAGVNRVSIGVQDFNQDVLNSVNRAQPYELTRKTVELCRWNHIPHISFDLLCGLPHQKVETMLETIDKACDLAPDRISFFSYAHVPWMKKHMKLIEEEFLPNTEERLNLFEQGKNRLHTHGYKMIGIDHFAKEQDRLIIAKQYGTLRRNFQGYTTDQYDTLIGLGTSAISQFKEGYTQNAHDIPIYTESLDKDELPSKKIYSFNSTDYSHADIIEDLMCHFQTDLSLISEKYALQQDYFIPYLDALEEYHEQGVIRLSGAPEAPFIEITEKPYIFARLVASVFDKHKAKSGTEKKHSNAI